MGKIGTFFKDYATAQKACREFNKKHWKGSIILSTLVGVGTFAGLTAYAKHEEKKFNKLVEEGLEEEFEYEDEEEA